MAYLSFSWWDYILFAVIIIASMLIGIYYGFYKTRLSAEIVENIYFVRDVKMFPIVLSFIAGTISVTDFLTVPAEIYTHGTQFWIEIFSIPMAGLIFQFFYMPIILKANLNSCYQYLEKRFSKTTSHLAMISYAAPSIVFMSIVTYGAALAFNQVTGFDIYLISAIIISVCTFYTSIGGLKAVIWADTLQILITLSSLTATVILATVSLGGLGTVWDKALQGKRIQFFELSSDPTVRSTFWNILIGHTCRWTAFLLIHPAAMQRILSVSNTQQSKKIIFLFVIGLMLFKSILCFTGLVIYSMYADCDPFTVGAIKKIDQIVPYFVLDSSSAIPGLGTLFVAGIVSMAPSVISTLLNVATSTIYVDLVYPLLERYNQKKWGQTTLRIICVILGIIGFAGVFLGSQFESLFEITYAMVSITSGYMLGLYTMGIFFPFANPKGILAGSVVSISFMLFWIIKSESYITNGIIRIVPKPISIEGCNITDLNDFSNNSTTLDTSENVFWLFRISFHYYIPTCCLICVLVGLAASWICRDQESCTDPNLLCPIIRRCIARSNVMIMKENTTKEQFLPDNGLDNEK